MFKWIKEICSLLFECNEKKCDLKFKNVFVSTGDWKC